MHGQAGDPGSRQAAAMVHGELGIPSVGGATSLVPAPWPSLLKDEQQEAFAFVRLETSQAPWPLLGLSCFAG